VYTDLSDGLRNHHETFEHISDTSRHSATAVPFVVSLRTYQDQPKEGADPTQGGCR
jgi:hypothetical protein